MSFREIPPLSVQMCLVSRMAPPGPASSQELILLRVNLSSWSQTDLEVYALLPYSLENTNTILPEHVECPSVLSCLVLGFSEQDKVLL